MEPVSGHRPLSAAPARRPQQPKPPAPDTYRPGTADEHASADARLRSLRFRPVPRVDEAGERALLGGQNQPGRMVQLAEGRRGAPTTLTIHGINGAPTDVQSLSERAAGQGHNVHTFAYDDRFRRLGDSSQDLATHVGDWMQEHPGQPLRIQAHSMGSRVALGALSRLQEQGKLTNPVQLDMIAPPLGGFGSANSARPFDFLGGAIGGLRPGVDMGTTSDFQRELENLRLPGVTTRIYTGQDDTVVDSQLPGFRQIAQNLRARQTELPGDHSGVIEQVARR